MHDSDSPEKRYLVAADTGGTFTAEANAYQVLQRAAALQALTGREVSGKVASF
jgi:hypothetical protein